MLITISSYLVYFKKKKGERNTFLFYLSILQRDDPRVFCDAELVVII